MRLRTINQIKVSLSAVIKNTIKIKQQMKQQLFCIILSLVFGSGGWAQQPASAEQKPLQAVVLGLFDALSELNVEKAKSFCTKDITLLESGKVWTFDSLALRMTTRKSLSTDFKRINKLDFIETKLAGETAWLSYFNGATITASGKTVTVKWLESVVLKKIGTEWKIALLHSTELTRTP